MLKNRSSGGKGYSLTLKCIFKECSSTFCTSLDLTLHLREKHKLNSKEKCPHCDKIVTSLSALVYHVRTHTGEKPYYCPVCGKRSATKANMQLHVGNMHGIAKSEVPLKKTAKFKKRKRDENDEPFNPRLKQAKYEDKRWNGAINVQEPILNFPKPQPRPNPTVDKDYVDLRQLVSVCIDLCQKASDALLIIQGSQPKEFFKVGPTVQQVIEQSLLSIYPDIFIRTKYPKQSLPNDNRHPLPNRNLVNAQFPIRYQKMKLKHFTIWLNSFETFGSTQKDNVAFMIGIAFGDTALAGVTIYPFKGKYLWGIRGVGLFGNCTMAELLEPKDEITTDLLQALHGNPLYLKQKCDKYALCAVEGILRSIGGTVTNIFGEQLFYGKICSSQIPEGCVGTFMNHHKFISKRSDPKLALINSSVEEKEVEEEDFQKLNIMKRIARSQI